MWSREHICILKMFIYTATLIVFLLNDMFLVAHFKLYSPKLLIYRAVIFVDEDDVATYTIKSLDDPRTLNKTIYLRPPENILSQNELIAKWEKLSGNVIEKIYIPVDEFLASMKGKK